MDFRQIKSTLKKHNNSLKIDTIKVGMISSISYQNNTAIRNVFIKLNQLPNHVLVLGAGNAYGADKVIRNLAIAMGFDYREYKPVHEQYDSYCALPKFRYNKKYNPKNYITRYLKLIDEADKVFVFKDRYKKDTFIQAAIEHLKKTKNKNNYIIVK